MTCLIRELLSRQHLLSAGNAVLGFLAGIFLKKPIEQWWENRGSLAQKRREMYAAVADVHAAVQDFSVRMASVIAENDTESRRSMMKLAIETFYEEISPGKYEPQLKAMQAVRSSAIG